VKERFAADTFTALRQTDGLQNAAAMQGGQKAAYEFGGMDALGIAGQFARFGQTMPEFAPCGSRRLFYVLLVAGGFARLVTTPKRRLSGLR
jgi:hypothetical protein